MSKSDNSSNEELRAVLARHASGRHHDTTFDHSTEKKNVMKEAPKSGGRKKKDPNAEKRSFSEILSAAGKRALGGGLPGAIAMGLQVGTLMWLRTTMNYQYRNGTSTGEALRALYKEGGIRRFYRGVGPALFQGPLSRFGDTAANAGMLSLLNSNESTRDLPVAAKTACASFTAGLWRINLMPIDTMKTTMQVHGTKGIPMLKSKFAAGGPRIFYHGALGAAGATMVGHYPWFFTYNSLNEVIPVPDGFGAKLGRNAVIGFCSSFVSDCTSNSIRVTKTMKQTFDKPITYPEAIRHVIKQDGLQGLFIRGLGTRIIANGFQGMLFTVLWKLIEEQMFLNK